MSIFLLNPYDADLDLQKKDDKRLFMEGCKGVQGFEFLGKRNKITEFLKLLQIELDDIRLRETLMISTKWTAGTRNPSKVIDMLRDSNLTTREVKSHCDLVWSDSKYDPATTPRFFKKLDTAPADDNELEAIRNKSRIKHVMLGKKLWNSLSPAYKVELSGDADEWYRAGNSDGSSSSTTPSKM